MLVVDPQTTQEIVLEGHKNLDPQPCFIYRYLSARKNRELKRAHDSINAEMDDDRAYELALLNARTGLLGWRHQKSLDTGEEIPFDPARIDEVCTLGEIMELVVKVLNSQRLSAGDKKKLDLPLGLDTAKSVENVKGPQTVANSLENTTQ